MSAINSNASSVAANFSFADLEKSVTGKYNRGELKLDQSGKLAKLNSHVWMTYRNTDVSTVAENIAVRNAVYQSIAKEFGNDGDAAEHLKVAREFLLGDKSTPNKRQMARRVRTWRGIGGGRAAKVLRQGLGRSACRETESRSRTGS